MSSPAAYIASVQRIDRIIKNKTAGLSHADSMRQLPFPANCLNWNLGHILVYRHQYLGVLDGVSQPDPADFTLYGGGSEPLTDPEKGIPLPTLLERLDEVSARIITALENLPAGRLGEIYDEEKGTTVADRLDFYLVFHEAYHAGQLEILHELALAQG